MRMRPDVAEGHGHGEYAPEPIHDKIVPSNDAGSDIGLTKERSSDDLEAAPKHEHGAIGGVSDSAVAQIIGVAILEFSVLLHSVLIGLTLAADPSFKVLFVVIIFHQMFNSLGVGSRLAYMELPRAYTHVPTIGAGLYWCTTPAGIAAGFGARTTYNPNGATASIVSGVLDAFSSGILIYTGLVELMAHVFIFNRAMIEESSNCMMLGAGLMALLGKWA
ncbi:Zinc/iron permease [Wolfiporia cocos MD-104 SS10]|uniref:Zinc/iron permease n=1 Tax=Wolfiporia cocos (strain MD-104) TaxID=742152 RepID=A0A2H3JRJ2_WOLCO|nr:Zinc/iron permease [Wolfiporia cocos MD-104 SS10]